MPTINDWLPTLGNERLGAQGAPLVDRNMSAFGDYAMTRTNRALLRGGARTGTHWTVCAGPDVFPLSGDRNMVNVYGKRGPTGPATR